MPIILNTVDGQNIQCMYSSKFRLGLSKLNQKDFPVALIMMTCYKNWFEKQIMPLHVS